MKVLNRKLDQKILKLTKNRLGLPLEYNKLSHYYDALSQSDDDSKNRVIEKILRKYKVNSVLDLTCGTGAQVIWLANHGYQVIGVDLSNPLLKIAKRKARKKRLKILFKKGDMRNTKVGKFDAVITIFNAIGHLTKSDFEKALRNIKRNLKENGIYIFDIFNLNSLTDKKVNDLATDTTKTIKHSKIRHIQYSKLNRKKGQLTSYDHFIIQKKLSKPKILKGKFTLQIYTAKELNQILNQNGFETLGQYSIEVSKFFDKKTPNILMVGRKK